MVIFGTSYGHAAPIEVLGRDRDLPPVYSNHNTYHLWGPPPEPIEVVVVVGLGDPGPEGRIVPDPELRELFGHIELARVYRCRWCMSWRDHTPIWIARDPKRPLRDAWPELRKFL